MSYLKLLLTLLDEAFTRFVGATRPATLVAPRGQMPEEVYRRMLVRLFVFFTIAPLGVALVAGMLGLRQVVAWTGLVWAIAFAYTAFTAAPLGVLLQTVFGQGFAGSGTRYVRAALWVFASGMFFCLGLIVVPVENNRAAIAPVLVAALLGGSLAALAGRGNVFRRIAKTTAGLVLVLAVFSFFFPRTTDRVRETVKRADAEGIQSVLPSSERYIRQSEFDVPLLGDDRMSDVVLNLDELPAKHRVQMLGPGTARAHFVDGTSGYIHEEFGTKYGRVRFTGPAGEKIHVRIFPKNRPVRVLRGVYEDPLWTPEVSSVPTGSGEKK